MTLAKVKKAMQEAGVTGKVSGHGVNWEVEVPDEAAMEEFCSKVVSAGGYRTGYGAWVLSADYQSNGDYSDRSSRWHY